MMAIQYPVGTPLVLRQDVIRMRIDAWKFRMVTCVISFHSFSNHDSSSPNLIVSPTCRPNWPQSCSSCDKYRDQTGQCKVVICRMHSYDTLAVCGPALSCWKMPTGNTAMSGNQSGSRISRKYRWVFKVRGELVSYVMAPHTRCGRGVAL